MRGPQATSDDSRPIVSAGLREELALAQRDGAIGDGPLEVPIAHALGFLDGLDLRTGGSLIDLGSGAGLPGLVIAEARPDLAVTLLDGRQERAARLQASIGRLGIADRVVVIGMRAEEAGRTAIRASFDAVVARGFGRPSVVAECAAPLLKIGGRLIVSEPPSAEIEDRWPTRAVEALGLAVDRVISEPYHYAVLRLVDGCPDRYPRRTGIPAKRPLF